MSEDHYERAVVLDDDGRGVRLMPPAGALATDVDYAEAGYSTYAFRFDYVFGMDSTQHGVYETAASDAVQSVLQGYNATIMAYGQTGAGKTHTMEGGDLTAEELVRRGQGGKDSTVVGVNQGIVPRAIADIFGSIHRCAHDGTKFLVRASYLQIYNEVVSDLIKPARQNLAIREDKRKGLYVDGLSEWVVRSPAEIQGLMTQGSSRRATGATQLNETSSRSHAVFVVIAERMHDGGDTASHASVRVGKLNLVDLAGSERLRRSHATGQRLQESKNINSSLSALGNVIAALTQGGRSHVPYRDSKLTRLLEDSLGGNCKTTMIATISPGMDSWGETLSTLKFGPSPTPALHARTSAAHCRASLVLPLPPNKVDL